jgi:hypothetical protein
MDPNTLLVGMIAGCVGAGYFMYGKKQEKPVPMLCGIALMVYPYFFTDLLVLLGIGVILMILPLFVEI